MVGFEKKKATRSLGFEQRISDCAKASSETFVCLRNIPLPGNDVLKTEQLHRKSGKSLLAAHGSGAD